MLDRIWVQIASKMARFWPKTSFKICKMSSSNHRVEAKVACLEGDIIQNCVLCCSRPAKFKLIIFGIIFDIKSPITRRLFSLGWNMTMKYRKLWWVRLIAICYLIRCDKQCVDLYLPQWGQGQNAKMADLKRKYSFYTEDNAHYW